MPDHPKKVLVVVMASVLILAGTAACDSGGSAPTQSTPTAVAPQPDNTTEPPAPPTEVVVEPTVDVGITPRVISPTETVGGGLGTREEIGGPPIPINKSGKIGNLEITVNSMRRWEGDDFYKPDEGNEYLLFDVTVTNVGIEAQRFTGSDLSLKNSTKKRAVGLILPLNKRTPSGTIAPGESKNGEWPTEIPKTATDFVMVVDPFGSDLVEIDLGQ